MSTPARRSLLRRIAWGVLLVGLLVVGGSSAVTSPARADDAEERAKEAAAGRTGVSPDSLRIGRKGDATYPHAGVKARSFKVRNERTGRAEQVLIGANGQVLDRSSLEQAEQRARFQKYGRLTPELAQQVTTGSPAGRIGVNIWLKEVPSAPAARPSANRESAGQVSPAQVQALLQDVHTRRTAAVRGVNTPIIQRLAALGIAARASELAPLIVAELTPAQIQAVSTWAEVDTIYPVHRKFESLDVVRPTTGASTVHTRGITGTGVSIGVIELRGRIATDNPFLAGITQDTTYVCTSPASHPTGVAGIIHSTDTTRRGIAPGSFLWVGGSCLDTVPSGAVLDQQLQDRTNAAVTWGVRAMNLSWGGDTALTLDAMDRFYDDIVRNVHRTVVVAAGNEGAGNGNVLSPALGYNVFTIGNLDDRNTVDRSDDFMRSTSSFRNPLSTNDDREKPEVTAPGTLINSTTLASPWIGDIGSGTSFAAPAVTGMAALLMQRAPILQAWPEIVKSITMVTAIFNIEGDARLSDRDGAGGIGIDIADDVARRIAGNWGSSDYTCSSPDPLILDTMPLAAGQRIRAAMAWDTNTAYAEYANQPSADIDLWLLGPSATLVAFSESFDNTYEIVDYTAGVGGTYTLQAVRLRCDISPPSIGWAWWRSGAVGTSRRLTASWGAVFGGTVNSTPFGITCGGYCAADYPHGTQVTLTPAPFAGFHFAGWSGACTNTSGPCVVTMDADKSVTASFLPGVACATPRPRLGVQTAGNGDGRLRVTITAGAGTLQTIQFGDPVQNPSVPTNASISVVNPAGGPANVTGPFVYTPPGGVTSVVLLIGRTGAGATTVPAIITDGCGPWKTFVGGGATAF
jgi:uncharacterized repeat protein (TIGR02543 family)